MLPGFVVAPLFFQGKIELGVVSDVTCALKSASLSASSTKYQI